MEYFLPEATIGAKWQYVWNGLLNMHFKLYYNFKVNFTVIRSTMSEDRLFSFSFKTGGLSNTVIVSSVKRLMRDMCFVFLQDRKENDRGGSIARFTCTVCYHVLLKSIGFSSIGNIFHGPDNSWNVTTYPKKIRIIP